MSKLTCLLVLLCSLLSGGRAHAADLGQPYTPTRAEWLQVAIAESTRPWLATWQQRSSVLVVVNIAQNSANVVVTLANGEKGFTETQKVEVLAIVRMRAEAVLKLYDWSRDVKLNVQFA
jgi:hypothetical protein